MPDKQTADQTARLLTLLPEEIIVDEKLDLRPWQGDEEREMDRIKALSESIKAEGQIEPGLVREVQLPDGTTGYSLVVGHRRRDAIALANYSLPAHKQIRMSVLVDNCDDRRALRVALMENIQRSNLSPMDMASNIGRIREQFGWQGAAGTRKVADFLKVSPAFVTSHEQLLTRLDRADQERVHCGELSMQAALDLMNVKPEKRAQVMEAAREKQQAETVQEEAARQEKGRTIGTEELGKRAESGTIKRKHVLAASREVPDALDKPKPRTRAEILEFFEEMDGPAYGHPDGQVRQFVQYLVDRWAKGQGATGHLTRLWNELTSKSSKGTPPSTKKDDKIGKRSGGPVQPAKQTKTKQTKT